MFEMPIPFWTGDLPFTRKVATPAMIRDDFYEAGIESCYNTFNSLSFLYSDTIPRIASHWKRPSNYEPLAAFNTAWKLILTALDYGVVGIHFRLPPPGPDDHYITIWSVDKILHLAHGFQDKFFFEHITHQKENGLLYLASLFTGLHKLWYPGIRDRSTWGKFGAHGEHGDVFLFSNLGAL